MKSKFVLAALAIIFTSSHQVQAEGLRFLPVLDKGFSYDPTLAVSVGGVIARANGSKAFGTLGLEADFNCGLLQTSENRIRTHLKLLIVDEGSLKAQIGTLSPPLYASHRKRLLSQRRSDGRGCQFPRSACP